MLARRTERYGVQGTVWCELGYCSMVSVQTEHYCDWATRLTVILGMLLMFLGYTLPLHHRHGKHFRPEGVGVNAALLLGRREGFSRSRSPCGSAERNFLPTFKG